MLNSQCEYGCDLANLNMKFEVFVI